MRFSSERSCRGQSPVVFNWVCVVCVSHTGHVYLWSIFIRSSKYTFSVDAENVDRIAYRKKMWSLFKLGLSTPLTLHIKGEEHAHTD